MSDTPRILIADDEAHILHIVSLKLRNAGYEVDTAEDGEDALHKIREQPPDLLITDLQMPFLNGLELCVELRRDPDLRELPALLLTARGASLEGHELARTNIRGVMSKPFSPREVLLKVESLLKPEGSEAVT